MAASKRSVPGADETRSWQRIEDNAFHLRVLSERWIGFSEDDAKTNRQRRKIFCALPAKRCSISNLGGEAASVCQRVEDNAFHLPKMDRLLRRRCQNQSPKAQEFTPTLRFAR
jgi:hypothetical protein